ncbi:MAG: glycosyltransferase family 4 protein [Patescibacteria group bacterium]
MKKLVIVTQAVDREDPNLGAFYYWWEMLAQSADSLMIIAGRAGSVDFPANVSVETFEKRAGILGRVRRLWRFWELCSRHCADADAVLFHQIPEFVLAAAPFLIGRRKAASLWYAHGAVSWRLRLAERLVHNIFTSSEAGFRLPSKKVFHLGQGINTDLFKSKAADLRPPTPNLALRLITAGRISPVKNCEIIIGACAVLRDAGRQFILTIAGDPITPGDRQYLEKLKTIVREKDLDGQVRFAGAVPHSEVADLLRQHDVFINASRTGSLDKAVLEAMACGLSVITANEAYRPVLPPNYFLERTGADALAERISVLSGEPRPNEVLRGIVARDHALAACIDRMADLLFNHQ